MILIKKSRTKFVSSFSINWKNNSIRIMSWISALIAKYKIFFMILMLRKDDFSSLKG